MFYPNPIERSFIHCNNKGKVEVNFLGGEELYFREKVNGSPLKKRREKVLYY